MFLLHYDKEIEKIQRGEVGADNLDVALKEAGFLTSTLWQCTGKMTRANGKRMSSMLTQESQLTPPSTEL